MQGREVVITGMGVVSPVANELSLFWERIQAGKSGIGRIQSMDDIDQYPVQIAGEVKDLDIAAYVEPKESRKMDPFTIYGLAAASMAVEDAALFEGSFDPERTGVLVSSGIGGMQYLQTQHKRALEGGPKRVSPQLIPQMITNILAGYISIKYGYKGPNFCITSACASGTHSIGEAARMISYGDADVMLAGGSEASIELLGVAGFAALRATSRRNDDPEGASRPFDKNRDGFVMSEGAGILVLESREHAEARGANIYCSVAGYGRTGDAYHITAPDESAEQSARGMALAVQDAGLDISQIDYINAHGTSTPYNDKGETKAIKKIFGKQAYDIAVSSSKSMTGHMLGATGAVESIVCALAIRDGVIPPTINYQTPDPECDLDYVPNQKREMKVYAALNNSLGFGGHNTTLCFKRTD
jgi:3-oxoacyl-[acyl-carrier-protein] synthase II